MMKSSVAHLLYSVLTIHCIVHTVSLVVSPYEYVPITIARKKIISIPIVAEAITSRNLMKSFILRSPLLSVPSGGAF